MIKPLKAYFAVIAAEFLVRDNDFDMIDALAEVDMILERVGLEAMVDAAMKGGKFENEAYVKMDRAGAKLPLNRERRVKIARSLNNAIEHAHYSAINDAELAAALGA